jgi:NADPH-dependent 2,4-dienoyl-CoA reductase/sulfur reductase-like enzyme
MGPTPAAKRVLVVGSGPAGLQAAIIASEMGHQVILCEKETWIGGKLPVVGAPPGKSEFNAYHQYLMTQLSKTGVDIRLNTPVTPELVTEIAPTDILIATGARPVIPDIPGVDSPHVFQADDALRRAIPGQKVVVLGASGTGCETAQFLREAGKDVTVIARSRKAARSIEPITRRVVLEEMRKAGIEMKFGLECVEIAAGHVLCLDANQHRHVIGCDAVILARGYESDRTLVESLHDGPYRVQVLGDAVKPRQILQAVTEAVLTAVAL